MTLHGLWLILTGDKMALSDKEQRVLKQTRLKNLKRKFAKISQHADLGEEAIELKSDIDALERELSAMK